MARGRTFSLVVSVLLKIYHDLNQIVNSTKLGYLNLSSTSHFFYLFTWLAYYLDTHNVLDYPLMAL